MPTLKPLKRSAKRLGIKARSVRKKFRRRVKRSQKKHRSRKAKFRMKSRKKKPRKNLRRKSRRRPRRRQKFKMKRRLQNWAEWFILLQGKNAPSGCKRWLEIRDKIRDNKRAEADAAQARIYTILNNRFRDDPAVSARKNALKSLSSKFTLVRGGPPYDTVTGKLLKSAKKK